MKYGIITYTSAQNWGGQLQAYSLYKYICSLGLDCELINYLPFDSRWFKPKKEIKDILFSFLMFKANRLRIQRFIDFRINKLGLNNKVYSTLEELRALNDRYDCFITGSDQLWNCETRINYPFYLDFVNADKKRISYAPSFGCDTIPRDFEAEISRLLYRYGYMSVRERSGADIVKRLTGKDIPVVLDPVFLHDEEQWGNILDLSKEFSKFENLFVYSTENSQDIVSAVSKFHKEYPKYTIYSPFAIPGVRAKILKDIGPDEFVNYIYNASFVITNSFHATAFSLIFRKPFCVVKHSTRFARVRDILLDLELLDRTYSKGCNFNFSTNDIIPNKIEDMVHQSKAYLEIALKDG